MSCRILVQCEGFENSILDLEPGVYTIGSDPENSIQLPLPGVEGFHGELEITEDNRALARDAGSMSGMMIDGEPVTESILTSSKPLTLGDAKIFYQPPVSPHPSTSARIHSPSFSEPDEPATWWAALPGTVAYPFISVLFVPFIFIAAFLNFPFGLGVLGLIATIVLNGSLVYIMLNTVSTGASGESPFSLGSFVEFSMEESAQALFQYTGLLIVCMGPAFIIGVVWQGDDALRGLLFLLAVGLGSLYLPIPFLALSLTGSLSVLNPVFVIRSFLRIPGPVSFMAFLLILINVGNEALVIGIGNSLGNRGMFELMFLGTIHSVMYYCVLNMWCRALGLMYHYYQNRLNWA